MFCQQDGGVTYGKAKDTNERLWLLWSILFLVMWALLWSRVVYLDTSVHSRVLRLVELSYVEREESHILWWCSSTSISEWPVSGAWLLHTYHDQCPWTLLTSSTETSAETKSRCTSSVRCIRRSLVQVKIHGTSEESLKPNCIFMPNIILKLHSDSISLQCFDPQYKSLALFILINVFSIQSTSLHWLKLVLNWANCQRAIPQLLSISEIIVLTEPGGWDHRSDPIRNYL